MTGCIRCCFWVRKVRIVSEVQVRLRQRSNPTERRVQETLYCEISTHALYLRQCPHVQATLLWHWFHVQSHSWAERSSSTLAAIFRTPQRTMILRVERIYIHPYQIFSPLAVNLWESPTTHHNHNLHLHTQRVIRTHSQNVNLQHPNPQRPHRPRPPQHPHNRNLSPRSPLPRPLLPQTPRLPIPAHRPDDPRPRSDRRSPRLPFCSPQARARILPRTERQARGRWLLGGMCRRPR